MKTSRLAGLIIAAVGVGLLLFGINAAEAPLEQITERLTGRYTDQTMAFIIGGAAAIVGGALLALFGRK